MEAVNTDRVRANCKFFISEIQLFALNRGKNGKCAKLHLDRSFITEVKRGNIFYGICDFSTSKVVKYKIRRISTRSDPDFGSNNFVTCMYYCQNYYRSFCLTCMMGWDLQPCHRNKTAWRFSELFIVLNWPDYCHLLRGGSCHRLNC